MKSLFERILGNAYDALVPTLRRVHDSRAVKRYAGRCDIRGDSNWVARLIAGIAGLPQASADVPITVTMENKGSTERWTRQFGGQRMCSILEDRGGCLRERLGPIVLTFELSAGAERIDWRFSRARLALVPLPISWLLTCSAAETMEDGRYVFDVRAHVRGAGLIVHYKGWLCEQ